jgi:HSP20 family protein
MAYRLSSTHPFDTLVQNLFQSPQSGHAANNGRYRPAVDLIESDAAYLIQVELPGFDPEALELVFEGRNLTLKGEKSLPPLDESAQAHLSERRAGSFERSFTFPRAVDPDAIQARFKHGVLAVEVAKRPEAQPHKVKIELAD